jgi:hypothetical protein
MTVSHSVHTLSRTKRRWIAALKEGCKARIRRFAHAHNSRRCVQDYGWLNVRQPCIHAVSLSDHAASPSHTHRHGHLVRSLLILHSSGCAQLT